MLINGIELSSLGVQLYDRVLSSNEIDSTQDWTDGDIQPTFIHQEDKFKKIQLQFLITSSNEEEAFLTMSKLTMLLKKATIIFDDIDLQFDVVLDGTTSQRRLTNGNFILTVNLKSDYAKGQYEIYTTDTRATDYFYLNVLYYQDNKTLLGTEKVLIKASQFKGQDTLESLGISLNMYQPNYYNTGYVTNFSGQEVNFENLQKLQNLMINYTPVVYSKEIDYYIGEEGIYSFVTTELVSFTKAQVDKATTIGQIIDLSANKPNGYKATTNFNVDLNFENLMKFPRLDVYYDKIKGELTKDITVNFYEETDDGTDILSNTKVILIKESEIYDGLTLGDIIAIDSFRPKKYYDKGIIEGKDPSALITFETLEKEYKVKYKRAENLVLVEYYLGTYPDWSRITTVNYKIKYKTAFDTSSNIIQDAGIDLNKYHTETYENGVIKNGESIVDFDSLLSIGVLQVSYKPKDYTIQVSYATDTEGLGVKDFVINDYMFLSNPTLGQVIDINAMRPEGYIFEPNLSYSGEVTLSALTSASPIQIYYSPVAQVKTKSIVVKYKQELSSAFSVLNTSVITVEESAIGGGTTLGDLINLNAYRPEYYNEGVVDGYSATASITFDELQGSYDVLYMATSYQTQVRYYTDEIDNGNWIGSNTLSYRIIDFTTTTTLVDLGLNINSFKPSYCDDGVVDYNGAVTFANLIQLEAINIVYTSIEEPIDPGISYPHRVLFLQHNDMGKYEPQFPDWTMNHAYINTGVTVSDMSKLTVVCDTMRVFDTEPLHNVNVNDAYLFGSMTPNGSYYIKFVNNTKFKQEELLTGTNTFNVCAGRGTPELIVTETASEGFSENTGISASNRPGYSYGTLTYTNLVQSNEAPVTVPLYLFACNSNGFYTGGIAGVGIKHCKIYYDNVLIRDFIPVAFYDKIGEKVAPSNCLYDKVSQTFFEDARGKNSFNIMDDPKYPDIKPEHQLGSCYVNYYQDDTLFQQSTIWFRGDEFVKDVPFDPYEKFFVDFYQPKFCGSGKITNLEEVGEVSFENYKNKIFNVRYDSLGYNIVVNYYKDSKSEANLLSSDTISLTEKDFYQVPTFGDIVPVQKYKPDSYKAIYTYPEDKVTLRRILEHAPYDIVYQKVDNPASYSTTVKYMKKGFGLDTVNPLNNYIEVGRETITLDETQFADGVYPEDFIDIEKYYPMSPIENKPFYTAGTTYDWYLKDENLITPDKLKPEYIILYEPTDVFIDVKYYTDVIEEANEIASTTWRIRVDDWEEGAQFYIVDELPNSYIDKYKPVICGGGQLENPNKLWTFEELVGTGVINIMYETLEEPHDPESTIFPSKVIWYDATPKEWTTAPVLGLSSNPNKIPKGNTIGPFIPYLDLGYTPKEIGRLRMETKAYSLIDGVSAPVNGFGGMTDAYSYFLGYYGGPTVEEIRGSIGMEKNGFQHYVNTLVNQGGSSFSPNSAGWMGFKGHQVEAGGFVWSSPGPQSFDGHPGWNLNTGGYNPGHNIETVKELFGGFRKGFSHTFNSVGEKVPLYKDYYFNYYQRDEDDRGVRLPSNTLKENWGTRDIGISPELKFLPAVAFNPTTMTLDAYNNYAEYYDYKNSMRPTIFNIKNKDTDLFTMREKPKKSLSAFLSTNPYSGTVNQLNFDTPTFLSLGLGLNGGGALGQVAIQNPWGQDFTGSITITQQVITGTNQDGSPIYETKTTTKNINYVDFKISSTPVPTRTMIWGIKIWDRNRLVRNLIPVAKGDNVYSFIAPENGMFDLVTETFYSNQNKGGHYTTPIYSHPDKRLIGIDTLDVKPEEVLKLNVENDPTIWGKVIVNYYDDDNNFLGNQYVDVPVTYSDNNISASALLHYNDFKPNEFYHDGMVDIDAEWAKKESLSNADLQQIYETGAINVYYKLITFTKTVVYYQGNSRVGSKDLFYSIKDLDKASSLKDLGIDVNLYASDDYKPGRIVFNEQVIADDDIQTFIDASSPIVVYDEKTKEEAPNLLYVDYYRAGAYDDKLITLDEQDPNYLNCQLDATVLNPQGCIKYLKHYHSALYEDEKQDYFIAYQVDVIPNLLSVKKGPHFNYGTLAEITDKGRYTILEEKDGWGRLKEYRNGWVLLSYTKPVVGPGQNPDYETPDISNVSIPFGTKITINKLTIDRLWAYCPEEASWIKTEEISYDQSGKLYSALHSQVVHLDTVDWSKVSKIEDLKIYPQSYKLKYHDDCDISQISEVTQSALSNLHTIEFVYPETIYTYNCIYYKDLVKPENELNRQSFSISLSDWNPDWDTFINTSYRKEIVNEFPIGINKQDNPVHIYKEPDQNSPMVKDIPRGYSVTIHGDIIQRNGLEWYPVVFDFIGKIYEGYVLTSYLTIAETKPWYRDINPQLYRDTPLTLTWDYFGMERNKFKPQKGNYDDGMYLWNPRTYENKDIYFTFEELVTTGVQKILYVHTLQKFKMSGPKGDRDYILTALPTFNVAPGVDDNLPGSVDIEFKAGLSLAPHRDPHFGNKGIDLNQTQMEIAVARDGRNAYGVRKDAQVSTPVSDLPKNNFYDFVVTNYSNKRNNTVVYGYGRDTTGFQTPFYGIREGGGDGKPTIKMEDIQLDRTVNTTTKEFDLLRETKWIANEYKRYRQYLDNSTIYDKNNTAQISDLYYQWVGYDGRIQLSMPEHQSYFHGTDMGRVDSTWDIKSPKELSELSITTEVRGNDEYPFFYKKIWNNFALEHYVVPIARGQWLPDGRQVQENSFYDIITNEISATPDCKVYKVGDLISKENEYSPFDSWEFATTNCKKLIKLKAKANIYSAPDILSRVISTFDQGTVIPIRQETEDANNHVKGLWYSDGEGWIQASDAETLPVESFSVIDYTPALKLAVKGDLSNKEGTYKSYLTPELKTNSEFTVFKSEKLEEFKFRSGDAYWSTSRGWVPVVYTENGYETIKTQYVVSADYLFGYTYPLLNNLYKVAQKTSGDRFIATKKLVKDNKWNYIDDFGWVYIDENNTQEII